MALRSLQPPEETIVDEFVDAIGNLVLGARPGAHVAHFIAAGYTPTHIDILGRPMASPEAGSLNRTREVGIRLESAGTRMVNPKE